MKTGTIILLTTFIVLVLGLGLMILWGSFCFMDNMQNDDSCNSSFLCHGRAYYGNGTLNYDCRPLFWALKK